MVHEVPDRIGPYRIERSLGRGGMGVVYLAHDAAADRKVALKCIHPVHVRSATAKERFHREVTAVAKLEHENICPIYDVGDDDGLPYFTMRYVDGVPLSRLLRSGFLSPVEAESSSPATYQVSFGRESSTPVARDRPSGESTNTHPTMPRAIGPQIREVIGIIECVARTLHFAHLAGIIHRDVKPSNIMVTPHLKVFLMDFGLAKTADAETVTGEGDLIGTVEYMSPELASGGRAGVDGRTDIFSTGVTLYELMTGARPFRGETRAQVLREVLFGTPLAPRKLNPGLSRDLETVILKCLERRPEARYADAAALADDLKALLELRPIKARPVGPLGQLWRAGRRNPVVAALSIVLFVATAVFTISNLRERQDTEFERSLRRFVLAVRGHLEETSSVVPLLSTSKSTLDDWLSSGRSLLAEADDLNAGAQKRSHEIDRQVVHELQRSRDKLERNITRLNTDIRTLDQTTRVTVVEGADSWAAARTAIRRSSTYGKLDLQTLEGLLPLGVSDESGLWEFWVPATGAAPIPSDTGPTKPGRALTLILVPGKTTILGAPPGEVRSGQDDPNEAQVSVDVPAFLISKYEMTYEQWTRIGGPRRIMKSQGDDRDDPRLPVHNVTWRDAMKHLIRLGLTLPTESQWERAARGDTTGRYWFSDATKLTTYEVVAEELLVGFHPEKFTLRVPGRRRQNPLGLYDVLGNVSEWTRDLYSADRSLAGTAKDQALIGDSDELRTNRGGSTPDPHDYCRIAFRRAAPPGHRVWTLGVRPAMEITLKEH